MAFIAPKSLRLREAHAHLPALGEWLTLTHLADCTSLSECLDLVRRDVAAARASGSDFVRMTSARVQAWPEGRWPSLTELDAVSGDVAVVIMGFDHHSAAVNTAAMSRARLVPGQQVADRGVVDVDPTTGQATGLLLEDAAYAAWRAAPQPTAQHAEAMVVAALELLARMGFVEVHDLHSPAWLGPALARVDARGGLPLNVGLYAPFSEIHHAVAQRGAWEGPRARLLGVKLFADGTLNSRTAHVLHRYSEPMVSMPRGQCMIAPRLLDQHIRECEQLGVQLAIHAIGDGAVRTVLDSVERSGVMRNRVRIEHAELIDRMDVPRFAALGVTCSVQPCHLLSDIEALTRFVPHRLDRVLPLRELLNSGLKPGHLPAPGETDAGLVFGSDVPIVRANPEDSIQAAVMRRREGMVPELAIAPEQAINEAEAWSCFDAGPKR